MAEQRSWAASHRPDLASHNECTSGETFVGGVSSVIADWASSSMVIGCSAKTRIALVESPGYW